MKIHALPLLLILAACGASSTPPGAVPPTGAQPPALPDAGQDSCGAAEHGDLVGQPVTALERELILGQVRIQRPGDMVTMDFQPERITFHIDEAERISRIACG
ncbi:I78 family peptidase inhibitor [Pseudoroseicyclus aestuarii]|uniref:Peptidase inhibitor I78 family protein n=1 Tax=Pseudoroseicyclus aestuarii TaxID=1795041 RepID=A0A318T249_9RHOB|nr:I78 family peptidase inhibitor [Pseudoroseicyclus aestuarii]PYE84284.1 peptidase inhibitor I78 family protein [Pseudoroseicyclus aestuarii]